MKSGAGREKGGDRPRSLQQSSELCTDTSASKTVRPQLKALVENRAFFRVSPVPEWLEFLARHEREGPDGFIEHLSHL